jgi:hypothetical protein
VTNVTDPERIILVNPGVSPVLLPKTKNLAESDKANAVVSAISHPVDLILIPVPKVCGMKLSKDIHIPIIPETHDVSQVISLTSVNGSIELRLIFVSHSCPVNIVHLANLSLLTIEDDKSIEVGMEPIPKSIVND